MRRFAIVLVPLGACAGPAEPGRQPASATCEAVTVNIQGVSGEASVLLLQGEHVVASATALGMVVEVGLPLAADPVPTGEPVQVALRAGDGNFLGLSSQWLVWSAEAGWTVMESQMSAASAPKGDCIVTVPVDLRPFRSVGFSGSLSEEEAQGRRIALVSALAIDGAVLASPSVVEVPAATTWALQFDGTPAPDQISDYERSAPEGGRGEVRAAWSALVLYVDTDASGGWSAEDSDVRSACAESPWTRRSERLGAVWVAPATSVEAASEASTVGLGTGWLSTVGANRAEREQAAGVVFADNCD